MAKNKKSLLHEHIDFLKYLKSISPTRQKYLIKRVDRPILETFSEICLNLIKKNITLPTESLNKLRPFKKQIYRLSSKKHSLISKRKSLSQRGGFVGTLLTTLLPILLGSVIGSAR